MIRLGTPKRTGIESPPQREVDEFAEPIAQPPAIAIREPRRLRGLGDLLDDAPRIGAGKPESRQRVGELGPGLFKESAVDAGHATTSPAP
jgi:hypothetical protein